MYAPLTARIATALTSAVSALAACSGTLSHLGRLEFTVGQASYSDIETEVPAVFAKYGYAIYANVTNGPNLYIETGWQERAPFDDEAAEGIIYARTRFIARARGSGVHSYTLRIRAENEVQPGDNPTAKVTVREAMPWGTMQPTDDYASYARQITSEIEMRVAAGVRTIRIH